MASATEADASVSFAEQVWQLGDGGDALCLIEG
jgi:hypothetical protein